MKTGQVPSCSRPAACPATPFAQGKTRDYTPKEPGLRRALRFFCSGKAERLPCPGSGTPEGAPDRRAGWDYQLALRRPGTSPRMVASRSLLRPRPNLLYTPRGRPDSSQRLRWRLGDESRGSLASLVAASIFSS
ncbi:hypothetical protein G6F24_015200 [Rhizopus arrhizus]|nr:hypothetical protein G6F24_015200 [Rhizopus arrhizus]